MPDFLHEKRSEIGARLDKLKPLVEEYGRLEAAAAALDSVPGAVAGTAASYRAAGRAATARPRRRKAVTGTPLERPKDSGTCGKMALELVTANPGITLSELTERLGIT
jgi:transposase